jgi:hypothetical protein
MNTKQILRSIAGVSLLSFSSMSLATIINTTLTGDIRYTDLFDLSVDVGIDYETAVSTTDGTSTSEWTIGLGSMIGDNSGAKLLSFYFNLSGVNWSDVTVIDQSAGWSVATDNNAAAGSGNAYFTYEAGVQGNSLINNGNALSFTLSQNIAWTESMFTSAGTSTGAAGSGQLGAHVGGLQNGCSAFLMGTYGDNTAAPTEASGDASKTCDDSTSIPEPSIIALFSLGLFGIGFARRRQS